MDGKADAGIRAAAHAAADGQMVDYVALLAELSLSEEEMAQAGEDMNRMLFYIDKLNELDTQDAEPFTHLFRRDNVFREDVVNGGYSREEMLRNAPDVRNGMFRVPGTTQ